VGRVGKVQEASECRGREFQAKIYKFNTSTDGGKGKEGCEGVEREGKGGRKRKGEKR